MIQKLTSRVHQLIKKSYSYKPYPTNVRNISVQKHVDIHNHKNKQKRNRNIMLTNSTKIRIVEKVCSRLQIRINCLFNKAMLAYNLIFKRIGANMNALSFRYRLRDRSMRKTPINIKMTVLLRIIQVDYDYANHEQRFMYKSNASVTDNKYTSYLQICMCTVYSDRTLYAGTRETCVRLVLNDGFAASADFTLPRDPPQ